MEAVLDREPFVSRKPDKERLRAALMHRDGPVPYWESTICRRNLEFLFGREGMPDLSWFLPVDDQIRIARWTGQDAIAGGGFGAKARVRDADGSFRYLGEGELRTWEQLESLAPYTDDDIRWAVRRVEQSLAAVEGTGIGVYVGCGGAIWQEAWQVVGFDDFMMMCSTDPEFVQRLLDYLAEPAVRAAEMLCELPLTFLLVGDNISTTMGSFIAPDDFKPLWCPWVERIIAPAKSAGIPTMLNTDGRLDWIIDDVIAMGFDAINPVDPNGNDILEVKRAVGDRLCLVGGIDQYWSLAIGTPDSVDRDVRERIERLRGGGGYIVSSSHDIGDNVVPENWVAMIRAVEKYGG
jgi:uroporphyrinogen-III decarboxylase